MHPSDRIAEGKVARKRVPRVSHAAFAPRAGRDPRPRPRRGRPGQGAQARRAERQEGRRHRPGPRRDRSPTLLAGLVGGGALGHFHHQGLGLKTEDRERLIADLQGGKAAVGVLTSAAEADAIAGKLTELGGDVEAHEVSDEALEAVAAAAPIEPEATATA